MDNAAKIEQYQKKLDEANTSEDVAKYLALLKTFKEIEQIDAEVKKTLADAEKVTEDKLNITYVRRTDWIRFIGLLAPMVTSIILIVTLMIQVSQTKEAQKAQKDEKEEEKMKQLTDKLSLPTASYNETIPTQLKEFFKSERYKSTALELTTSYLSNVKSEDTFNNLFKEYMKFIDKDNYTLLVRLTRKLLNQYFSANAQKAADSISMSLVTDTNKSFSQAKVFWSQRIADDDVARNRASDRLITASRELADQVRKMTRNLTHVGNNSLPSLDLTDAYFYYCSLDSVSFDGVIINNVTFDHVSFYRANLVNIKGIESSVWDGSSWWLANDISDPLLRILSSYPFDENAKSPESNQSAQMYQKWIQKSKFLK
jgi:hypothetical protein